MAADAFDETDQAHQCGLHVLKNRGGGASNWEMDWPYNRMKLNDTRCEHASVSLIDPLDATKRSIVVLGGLKSAEQEREQPVYYYSSVWVLDISSLVTTTTTTSGKTTDTAKTPLWRPGPAMKEKRSGLAAVYCNQYLYAIGGYHSVVQTFSGLGSGIFLDTIERIPISELIHPGTKTATTTSSSSWLSLFGGWKSLACRLSTPRQGCCAVTVHDRFIVVMGGYYWQREGLFSSFDLSSVDIIDTGRRVVPKGQTRQSVVTIAPGPPLCQKRKYCGAAVLDNTIWVVGGLVGRTTHIVEYLSFHVDIVVGDDDDDATKSTASIIKSSNWRLCPNLDNCTSRWGHGVTRVGQCFVVAGGWDHMNRLLANVEVLAPQQQGGAVVWKLANLSSPKSWCSLLHVDHYHLLVVGGASSPTEEEDAAAMYDTTKTLDTIESLPIVQLSVPFLKQTSLELQRVEISRLQVEIAMHENNTSSTTVLGNWHLYLNATTRTKEEKERQDRSKNKEFQNDFGLIVERRCEVECLQNTLIFYYLWQQQRYGPLITNRVH